MSHKSSLVLQNPTKLDEECRMAYLAVVNSTTDNIKSSKELAFGMLLAIIQNCSRNNYFSKCISNTSYLSVNISMVQIKLKEVAN